MTRLTMRWCVHCIVCVYTVYKETVFNNACSLQLTTATSCRMSAASATLPSASRMLARRRVSRARSIST